MSEQLVSKSIHENVGLLKLSRPSTKNAISIELADQLGALLDEMDRDPTINAIVLEGEGNHFAAGADVKEMVSLDANQVLRNNFSGCCERLADMKKPVIAAVEGFALGGGCELIEMCDIVIASETAKFGHPEIKLGTMSGAGGTQRLPRVVGKHWAMDMLLTGRFMSAQEAYMAGLVSRIVTPAQLHSEAMYIARRIADQSAPVVKMIKQAVNEGLNDSLVSGLSLERRLFHLTFALADRKEGMEAFCERRKPIFANS
jgi:enoyl-CoA hydratase